MSGLWSQAQLVMSLGRVTLGRSLYPFGPCFSQLCNSICMVSSAKNGLEVEME